MSRDNKIAACLVAAGLVAMCLVYFIGYAAPAAAEADTRAKWQAEEERWAALKLVESEAEEARKADTIDGYVLEADSYMPNEWHCGYLYAANVSSTDQLTDPAEIVIWLVSIDIQMKGKWSPRSVVGAHIRAQGAFVNAESDEHLGVPVKRMNTAVFEILADNVVSSEYRQAIVAFRKGDTTFLARRAAEAERRRFASLNEDTVGAVVYAEAIVRALLRSPSTAEFEGGGLLSGRPTTAKAQCLGDGLYIVTSFVDSQNGFGAMVRTDWSLKLKKGPGESWRVVKVLKMDTR